MDNTNPVIEVRLLDGATIKATLVEMTTPGGPGTVIVDFKNRHGVILPRFWEVESSGNEAPETIKLAGVQPKANVAIVNRETGWATLLRGEIDTLVIGLADLVKSCDGEFIQIENTPFAYSVVGNPIIDNCRMEGSHRRRSRKVS